LDITNEQVVSFGDIQKLQSRDFYVCEVGLILRGETKSGKGRRVRLTRRAVTALRDHRKLQLEVRMRLAGLWQDQGLVFASETGSLLNPSNLRNRSFKRIKTRSGVRKDLRFHDLRHTCATLLLSEGVNVKVVSEMLGHASVTITLNTYAHVLPDMQDSAADAMEAALGAIW
jgi:integrase